MNDDTNEILIGDLPVRRAVLSPRELECLVWVSEGKSNKEVGAILNIHWKTVNTHIEHAKAKLGVTTRIQAVVTAMRQGLIR